MCARWRRGGHLWRRSPLEDPPLEPLCGTPAGAPPPLEAPSTGLRHPGPMAVSLITWITTDPRLPHPPPLAHPPIPSGRGSLPCEPFPPPLVPRELRAPPSTTQSYTRHPRSDWHSLGLLWGTPRPDKAGPPTTGPTITPNPSPSRHLPTTGPRRSQRRRPRARRPPPTRWRREPTPCARALGPSPGPFVLTAHVLRPKGVPPCL